MRAKSVNENVNFERGRDPKSAMGLGDPVVKNVVDWLHGESETMFWNMDYELPYPTKKDVYEFVTGNIPLMKELSTWEDDWLPEENLMTGDVISEFQDWWIDKDENLYM